MDYIFENILSSIHILLLTSVPLFLLGWLFRYIGGILQNTMFDSLGFFTFVIIYPFIAIHELCHLVMALLFTKRIVSFRLFKFRDLESSMGYVQTAQSNTRFKLRRLYENIGDFFVGLAPLFLGTIIILFLMFLFANTTFTNMSDFINSLGYLEVLKKVPSLFLDNFLIMFIISLVSVSSLFFLSQEDMKVATSGFPYLVGTVFFVNLIFGNFSVVQSFFEAMIQLQKYINLVSLIVILYAILIWILLLIISVIKDLINEKNN